MSMTSMKPAEEEVSDVSVHGGKERRVSALSTKGSRKQDKKEAAGEGGTLTPKKEKKLKPTAAGTGRLKNKPSAQSVQAPADAADGSEHFYFLV